MNTEQNVSKTSEVTVTGRRFRQLIGGKPSTWGRFCGWYATDRPFTKATPMNNNTQKKE